MKVVEQGQGQTILFRWQCRVIYVAMGTGTSPLKPHTHLSMCVVRLTNMRCRNELWNVPKFMGVARGFGGGSLRWAAAYARPLRLSRTYASEPPKQKEELTPLAKHIRDQIKIGGSLSVAQFMRSALTHPLGGYYMKGDVFGAAGDFTTSPEISQMFGEVDNTY